ncbi:MAG: diguanylate cyclase [Thermoleophilia bacterium]
MSPLRRSALRGHAAAVALVAVTVAVGCAVLVAPLWTEESQLTWLLQALAQAVAAVACLRATRVAEGGGRAAWALLGIGQAIWSATNAALAVALLAGADIPEVSVFDAAWLIYYGPTLLAVIVFYGVMQPEPGWLGIIDALVLTAGAAVLAWTLVLVPIAEAAGGGTADTLVNSLYPGLDLLGLSIVGWITIRRRATPRWTVGLAAFFGLSVLAGVFYLDAALAEHPLTAGASGLLYTLSSTALVVAADMRRTGGRQARATAGGHTVPPAWSQLLLPALVVPLAWVIGTGGPAGVAALAVVLAVVARLSWSLLVLARLGEAHEALLRRDPLTGAHNRRFLGEELGRLTARAVRSGEPLAALVLDLDGFKALNDTRGHAAGDAFLSRLVSEMRVRLRSGDVLCRQGGDEFVVLLPATDEQGALLLARRMLDAVEATRHAVGLGVPVGGSAGVVAARADGGVQELLPRADSAMYAAKWAGGGRVVAWHGGLDAILAGGGPGGPALR